MADTLQDMMTLVKLTRGYDNRPVHERMLEEHAQKEAIRKLEKEVSEDA